MRSNSGLNVMSIPEHLQQEANRVQAQAHNLIQSSATWRQSYYNLQIEDTKLTTEQPLTKLDISTIMSMIQ